MCSGTFFFKPYHFKQLCSALNFCPFADTLAVVTGKFKSLVNIVNLLFLDLPVKATVYINSLFQNET